MAHSQREQHVCAYSALNQGHYELPSSERPQIGSRSLVRGPAFSAFGADEGLRRRLLDAVRVVTRLGSSQVRIG